MVFKITSYYSHGYYGFTVVLLQYYCSRTGIKTMVFKLPVTTVMATRVLL